VEVRRNAVWAATRIDQAGARAAVRRALADADETVRQAALHSVSVWRDRAALPALLGLLQGASWHNRRAAAEALGRLGDKSAVPALLDAVGHPTDRVLEHSLTYALMEIADPEGTAAGLRSPHVLTRRAALTALDQMGRGRLRAGTVAAELSSTDPRMKETAWWIAARHPGWGGALAGFLRDRLAARNLSAAEREELVRQLARFARAAPVQEMLAEHLRDATATPPARRIALRAMAEAGLKEAPDAWVVALTGVVAGGDAELIGEAAATARALRIRKGRAEPLGSALRAVGGNAKVPVDVRLRALAAVPGGLAKVEPSLFAFLRAQLGPDRPVATRALAADVLARARLDSAQLVALAESLPTAGPMEVARLLEAFGQSADDDVGRKLVAALKGSAARSGLRAEVLKPHLAKFGAAVRKQAEGLYASLDADAARQQARLEELLAGLKGGDVRRGQAVFNSPKAACSSCHAIGYLGGKVGPDLTHIGKIRGARDLLESIVFPSASLVRSYEPVLVTTRSGKTYNGLVRKDTPDEVVLATGADQEVRIARGDIEEVQPSQVSVMPAGLDRQLTPGELADLVAFLRACQ
jgi:putative heme-binding domain-containing protein